MVLTSKKNNDFWYEDSRVLIEFFGPSGVPLAREGAAEVLLSSRKQKSLVLFVLIFYFLAYLEK